jgi:hypothetical protein
MIRAEVIFHKARLEPRGNPRKLNAIAGVGLVLATIFCAVAVYSEGQPAGGEGQTSAPNLPSSAVPLPDRKGLEMREGATATEPPTTAVLALNGVCDPSQTAKGTRGCRIVVTKAEMDHLLRIVQPNASPAEHHQFEINYLRLAAAAGEAQRRHLEADPQVAEQIRTEEKLVRMQVLANSLYRSVEKQANDVPAAEVEKYFEGHRDEYKQEEVRRVYIPKTPSAVYGKAEDLEVLKALAEDVRRRALAGEDFDALQKDVFVNLGIKTAPPATKVTVTKQTKLPAPEAPVLGLETGRVSDVVETAVAFEVLKMESRGVIPLESARADVLNSLQRERMQTQIREITENGKTKFNLSYLELPAAPDLLPPPQVMSLPGEQGTASLVMSRGYLKGAQPSHKRGTVGYPPIKRPTTLPN